MTRTPTETDMALDVIERIRFHHQDAAYFAVRGLAHEAASAEERFYNALGKLKAMLEAGRD